MKKISIGQNEVLGFIEEVRQKLASAKGLPEKIELYTNRSTLLKKEEHVQLIFEDTAWRKMWALIDKLEKEVGWHGVVEREGDKIFRVKDILMFPQTVTGATVTTDDEEFALWDASIENETYNKMKFYGHSHVRMGVFPSTVDTNYIANKIQNELDFYIFGIFNKSKSSWLNIYDVSNNTLYENSDIDLKYMCAAEDTWAEEQIEKYVTEQKVVVPPANSRRNYGGNSWKSDDWYNGSSWEGRWGEV